MRAMTFRQRGTTLQRCVAALAMTIAIGFAACGGDGDDEPPRGPSATPESTAITTMTSVPAPGSDAPWIAYQTDRSGGESVWLIHPDGSENHRIAADVEREQLLPDWSPDGNRLVFTTRGGATEPLYEFDLQTEAARKLFACDDPCLGDDEPVYSPDGAQIAFIRAFGPIVDDLPSDCGIWIGTISDLSVREVTSNARCDREYFPRWSPDGTTIIYTRGQYDDNGIATGTAIYTISVDGGEQRQLTDYTTFSGSPDWSPDGEWIVYSTYPLNEFQCCSVSNLFRMRPDGSSVEQLTEYATAARRATQPRYTPDGSGILFTLVTERARTLSVLPLDGGEPAAVTKTGIATHGAWQP